jgi:hypothetical protein
MEGRRDHQQLRWNKPGMTYSVAAAAAAGNCKADGIKVMHIFW